MLLNSLVLKQFRNYEDRTLEFSPGLNLIYGSNASGKSNILEAVYLLAKSRSIRTSNIKEAAMWGKSGFFLKGVFNSAESVKEVSLRMDSESGKIFKLNGKEVNRLSEYVGEIPVVLFVPDDLRLIKGEPELRRKYINSMVIQSEPSYWDSLVSYGKTVAERNQALKQLKRGEIDIKAVDVWTDELVAFGSDIIRARERFIREINGLMGSVKNLFGRCGIDLELKYKTVADPAGENLEGLFAEVLLRRRNEELVFCQTLTGPHRDELEFYSHGRLLKSFGSQGQQRKAVLMLKIASVFYLREHFNEWPVTLFDDVLSELDEENQHAFENLLIEMSRGGGRDRWQCFITTAEKLKRWNSKDVKLINIKSAAEQIIADAKEKVS